MAYTVFWGDGALSMFSLSRVYGIYSVHETTDGWPLHLHAVMWKMKASVQHPCDKINTGIYNTSEI